MRAMPARACHVASRNGAADPLRPKPPERVRQPARKPKAPDGSKGRASSRARALRQVWQFSTNEVVPGEKPNPPSPSGTPATTRPCRGMLRRRSRSRPRGRFPSTPRRRRAGSRPGRVGSPVHGEGPAASGPVFLSGSSCDSTVLPVNFRSRVPSRRPPRWH